MGLRQKISLLCNDSIKTPMVIGVFKTCLIIPKVDMDKRELQFIFHHELTHCKRKDLWFKAVAWFANAVHWFNPLVYRMVCDINEYCEISCDEAVVKDMSREERYFYGETILNVLSRVINKQEGLYSNLCESEKGIKRRLIFIMKKKNFSPKMIATSIVILIVICITGLALAYTLAPSDENLAEDSNWKTSLDEIDSKALPTIGICLKILEQGPNYCKLEWSVENKSDITATFLEGNIEQYEVENTHTNKKYSSKINKKDIILNKGDE